MQTLDTLDMARIGLTSGLAASNTAIALHTSLPTSTFFWLFGALFALHGLVLFHKMMEDTDGR